MYWKAFAQSRHRNCIKTTISSERSFGWVTSCTKAEDPLRLAANGKHPVVSALDQCVP
jgi:hypothetical protein